MRKAKIKRIGSVVVELNENGNTLNVPATMHEEGATRFVHSKRFVKVKGDGRELLKEGEETVLVIAEFKDIPEGSRFWCMSVTGKDYKYCRKQNGLCKSMATEQILSPWRILIPKTVTYSFTIKTNPAQQVNTMATKKATPAAATKKTATKKAAAPKAAAKKAAAVKTEEKGPGKIQQILALHKAGKSNAEIVEAGFNKTTVSIQVARYKREKAAAKEAKAKG